MLNTNPLAGEYRGKAAVLELLGRVMEMTRGRFRPEVHDILASDDAAALVTVYVERDNRRPEWKSIDLFHLHDGELSEHWVHEVDQDIVDRFFS